MSQNVFLFVNMAEALGMNPLVLNFYDFCDRLIMPLTGSRTVCQVVRDFLTS